VLKDFRWISLCNVIYKVVSKCMVNRLWPVLHDVIGPMQSAFVPGRMVTDNAVIAFECLHVIRSGNEGCRKFYAYKLDLTKVYDHVDWGFLRGVQERLGFSKWVQWVMECVSIVTYSVRFNNVPLEPFKPSHDLRQGDPLSLYLFLFVADGLSQLLQQEIQRQRLHELRINRSSPGISHLLFVDDTLLFVEASENQDQIIKDVLCRFERSTGQLINPSKCSLLFGSGCPDAIKESVAVVLNVHNTTLEEKYLGLPTPTG
jgi:hypothetical protein